MVRYAIIIGVMMKQLYGLFVAALSNEKRSLKNEG